MAARISHRGPDGGGIAGASDATLGMTRLAIVDVDMAISRCSMTTGRSSSFTTGGLQRAGTPSSIEKRGVRFRTRSDTEVILRLYENDPEHVEEHLVGMWAFAIHDRRRGRVIISRDRFGIKPLFIADSGTALAFASELRCFDRTLSPFPAVRHRSWCRPRNDVVELRPGDRARFIQGVKRLAPASRITVDLATGARRTHTYWSLEPSQEAATVGSLDEACGHVETLLRRPSGNTLKAMCRLRPSFPVESTRHW